MTHMTPACKAGEHLFVRRRDGKECVECGRRVFGSSVLTDDEQLRLRECHGDQHVAGCLHGIPDYQDEPTPFRYSVSELQAISGGIPGMITTRTYAVSLPRWARRIRQAAEAVITWTKRFETHTRIG